MDDLETVEHFIVMGDGDAGALPNVLRYEELLAEQGGGYDYPELDDRAAASLCYTSGTTGNPKGVLYSHRSTLLHVLGICRPTRSGSPPATACCPWCRCSTPTPGAWPTRRPMAGADLVMPGRFLQAEPLARLIESERVTVAGAVPTIWLDLLRHVRCAASDLSAAAHGARAAARRSRAR